MTLLGRAVAFVHRNARNTRLRRFGNFPYFFSSPPQPFFPQTLRNNRFGLFTGNASNFPARAGGWGETAQRRLYLLGCSRRGKLGNLFPGKIRPSFEFLVGWPTSFSAATRRGLNT